MRASIKNFLIAVTFIFLMNCNNQVDNNEVNPSREVISRIVGVNNTNKFELSIDTTNLESYSLNVHNNKVHISVSNQVALYRGAYYYHTNACNSTVSWSGKRVNMPEELPQYASNVKSLL